MRVTSLLVLVVVCALATAACNQLLGINPPVDPVDGGLPGMTGQGGAGGGGAAGGGAGGATASGPCDVLAAAGNPCVAAHSTVRALFRDYSGPLYQVCLGASGPSSCPSGMTRDIGVAAGGYADSASQDTFCAGSTCTVSIIYDQSSNANHLRPATPGGAKTASDNSANAT